LGRRKGVLCILVKMLKIMDDPYVTVNDYFGYAQTCLYPEAILLYKNTYELTYNQK